MLIKKYFLLVAGFFICFNACADFNFKTSTSISLPNGFHPESIIRGYESTAYVGSLLDGRIYKLDLSTGVGEVLVDGVEGNIAAGMAYDERTNYVYAAGALNGTVRVYDGADGELKAEYKFTDNGFINDGVVTANAAYFTDSFLPVLYKIPLTSIGRLPDPSDVETIPFVGDFQFIDGGFNSNGIESIDGKDELIVVNFATGVLYGVNGISGAIEEFVLPNGNLTTGDGLLKIGRKLYVVEPSINQLTELFINKRANQAVVTRTITDPLLQIPTAVTFFDNAFFIVNARFDVAPPPFEAPSDPSIEFSLTRIPAKAK